MSKKEETQNTGGFSVISFKKKVSRKKAGESGEKPSSGRQTGYVDHEGGGDDLLPSGHNRDGERDTDDPH